MQDVAMAGGDLVINNGDLSLDLTDEYDIIQMANNIIATVFGENPFHVDIGNDAWNKRLKIDDSGFATVEADAKEAILHIDDRVMEILDIKASAGENYGECIVAYILMTVDGRIITSSTSISLF